MTDMPVLDIRKGFFTAILCSLCVIQPLGASPSGKSGADRPVSERSGALSIISDLGSGLALFGYDPVAYHIDGKAMEGRREFSQTFQQLEWRFVSAANRDAFIADPSAYIPAFGGHDGHAVSEGRMTTGDPLYFVITSGELVLFRSMETRDRFRTDPEARKSAFLRWPDVTRQHGSH